MRTRVTILLISLYTLFNIGLVLNTHYCGGKIASVSLFSNKTNCGSCGKNKMDTNCCHTTQTHLSIDDNQIKSPKNANSSNVSFLFVTALLYHSFEEFGHAVVNKNTDTLFLVDTWPSKTPLYVKFQALII